MKRLAPALVGCLSLLLTFLALRARQACGTWSSLPQRLPSSNTSLSLAAAGWAKAALAAAPSYEAAPTTAQRCPAAWDSIYFLHVRKCGGSYLHSILKAGLEAHGTRSGRGGAWCDREAFDGDAMYAWDACSRGAAVTANISARFPAACNGMATHNDYGLLEELLPAGGEQRQRALTLTTLRHPVWRVVSEYYYYMKPEGPAAANLSLLLAYAEQPQNRNRAVRQLGVAEACGWQGSLTAAAACDVSRDAGCGAAVLARAKRHLAGLCWFGLQERMEDSLVLLQPVLGWPELPAKPLLNVYIEPHAHLPPDTYSKLLQLNAQDAQLYSFAAEVFEHRLAAVGWGVKQTRL